MDILDIGIAALIIYTIIITLGIIALLTERARAGDKRAEDALRFFDAARDMIPLDKLSSYVDARQILARETPTPVDDALWDTARTGLDALTDEKNDDMTT